MEAISKGIGTGGIEHTTQDLVYSLDKKMHLLINLKMKTSDVFKDGEPPEDAEDPEEAAKKLKFPWHSEKGIVENIRLLNDEFNKFRGLNPVKIFITGPPASGKSFYATLLREYYNIPIVTVKQLVEKALSMGKIEESEDELVNEIKAKIEELRDAEVAKIEAERELIDP